MNVGYIFLFAAFVTFIALTKEVPIGSSNQPARSRIPNYFGTTVLVYRTRTKCEERQCDFLVPYREGSTHPPDLADEEKSDEEKFSSPLDRSNHSRMLTLTTLAYDEWWFYTTRRPPLSFKDFPGRPGVATWREISPGGSSEESRKSRKMSTPTAAGVSSSSQSFPSKYHYPQIIWMLFLLLCFCWT